MRYSVHITSVLLLLGAAIALPLAGCNPAAEGPSSMSETDTPGDDQAPDDGSDGGEEHASHDHSGWWCPEHGVPEGDCTRCNFALIDAFRQNGDWCDEHTRPDTQCFLCHPELEATFAARYEAKFGKKPPKPTDL